MSDEQPPIPANVLPLTGDDREALLRHLLDQAGLAGPDPVADGLGFLDDLAARSQPELLERPEEVRRFTVRVDLDDAKPPIWRRLVLAGDLTLDRLHEVLQAAMGWTDSHLHQFTMGPVVKDYRMQPFVTDYGESEGDEGIPEREVRLDEVVAEPGHRLFYEYDFGDGWDHTLKVESIAPPDPDAPAARCVGGRRACPPEDVGGIGGYEELVEALGHPGPHDDWVEERLAWLPAGFDPAHFDLAETDDDVRRLAAGGSLSGLPPLSALDEGLQQLIAKLDRAGAAYVASRLGDGVPAEVDLAEGAALAITAPWRTFLEAAADGIRLTGAGYLPPAMVVELVATLPFRREIWGKGNREEHTPPVAHLRESAVRLGLVRKANGRLQVTAVGRKLAGDPLELVHHIAGRLPLGRGDHELDAGWLALVHAAAGLEDTDESIAAILAGIGWRVDGQPPSFHAHSWAAPTTAVLALAGWNPGRYADLRHDPRASKLAQLALRS